MEIVTFLIASVLIEAIINIVSGIYQDRKLNWKLVASIAFGILIAYAFSLDFFKLVGLESRVPYLGTAATGMIVSRGSNYVSDLWSKVTAVKIPEGK